MRNTLILMTAYAPKKRNSERCQERSGRYIYIPKRRGSGENARKLEELIGWESLKKLIEQYGGDRIYLSSSREFMINYRISCILDLKRLGVSARDIASFFNVTERYVFKLTQGSHGE